MWNDLAHKGILPTRALETILGGAEPPRDGLTAEEMRALLMQQPDKYSEIANDYDATSLWLARQFYLLLAAGETGDCAQLYEKMIAKIGRGDYDLTGYMVGWAANAARYALNQVADRNPALLEIKSKADET